MEFSDLFLTKQYVRTYSNLMAPRTAGIQRERLSFRSGKDMCSAWHYQGTNGACVVMAGGLGVPKEPGTHRFAARFSAAGYSVLTFDYRYIGESGGTPRSIVRVDHQIADWQRAIGFAATLSGVDPRRIAIWGFSLSGGHVIRVAAKNPSVSAVIAQTPNADGLAATRNAIRHQRLGALLRFTGIALVDTVGGWFGRQPRMVALAGVPGSIAVLTTPDAIDANRALNPENQYPSWAQNVAARSALPLGRYRPGSNAKEVACPMMVLVCDNDQSALAKPAIDAAHQPRILSFSGCPVAITNRSLTVMNTPWRYSWTS
jgi:uncharacterized protein